MKKNLPIPVTNVSSAYYMRQLWIHTFKNETADMFVYSEHFSGKRPSEYVKLIKETGKKLVVNYANFPLTDDLQPHKSNIVIIKNFKKHFENILVNSVEHLTQIRKIKFSKGVCATTDHLSENYEINVNLVKPNFF
jgi:hypothetical protein